jgi:hypothetical protein
MLDDIFVDALRSCSNLRSLSIASFGATSLAAFFRVVPSFPLLVDLRLTIDVDLSRSAWVRAHDVPRLHLRTFMLEVNRWGRLEPLDLGILLASSRDTLDTLIITFEASEPDQASLAADVVTMVGPTLRQLSLAAVDDIPAVATVRLRTPCPCLETLKLDHVAFEPALLRTLRCRALRVLDVISKEGTRTRRGTELARLL